MKEIIEQIENRQSKELPRVIDTQYPYVALGDLSDVVKRITGCSDINVQPFQDKLYSMFKEIMPENSTFYPIAADSINTKIEERVRTEIKRTDKKVGIVNLDRYLCSNIQSNSIFQVNISRGSRTGEGLISRPGEKLSPKEQVENLILWIKDNNYQEIIIVDDVLAFGDTLVPFINEDLRKGAPETTIRVLVGLASSGGSWNGIERVKDETGVTPEYLTRINASAETDLTLGMAIPTSRDFTFLGGKVSKKDDIWYSYPYFYPFSIPQGSFMPKERRVDSARNLFTFNLLYQHISAEFWEGI
jgi:uracil phosphoribosyltransferase